MDPVSQLEGDKMYKPTEQIINEIREHMKQCGGAVWDWNVGITAEPRNRLFGDHRVNEQGDAWIFREAANTEVAREIEAYFINVLGADGGTGGGDADARFVYAYKRSEHTDP